MSQFSGGWNFTNAENRNLNLPQFRGEGHGGGVLFGWRRDNHRPTEPFWRRRKSIGRRRGKKEEPSPPLLPSSSVPSPDGWTQKVDGGQKKGKGKRDEKERKRRVKRKRSREQGESERRMQIEKMKKNAGDPPMIGVGDLGIGGGGEQGLEGG